MQALLAQIVMDLANAAAAQLPIEDAVRTLTEARMAIAARIEAETSGAARALEEEVRHLRDDVLSASEVDALAAVGSEVPNGGLVIASKVADAHGFTRSVIVNGFRKLEAAQVIRTRSLGMKGSKITVLRPKLWRKVCGLPEPVEAIEAVAD